MNDDQLDDLKQFITSTFTQTEERLGQSINAEDLRLDSLEMKVDDIDAKADAILKAVGERLDNHEVRISKLEHQTV